MGDPEITIAGRKIGVAHPPYVICEISANHNGDLERAIKSIEAAAQTGADAIKLQTYTADTLTIDSDRDDFRVSGGLWDGRTLYDLYSEAQTPFEWHEALFRCARDLGVTLFSTPFDDSAVQLLADLEAPAYKIASFEIVDLPLIRRVAREGRPMIISAGMANLAEMQDAVATAREAGCGEIAMLHCVSSYPAPAADSNIATIPHLADAFDVVSGLSDHTHGTAVAAASVAIGGAIVEKHFTLSRADGGPDSAFSLEPDEFRRLVDDCRSAWAARGRVHYDLKGSEQGSIVFRRSLYVVKDIEVGEALSSDNVRSIRPGHGLAPKHYDTVIGQRARRALRRGEPLKWDAITR